MTRIPLPAFPNGWFAVAYADQVERGVAKSIHLLGREFVIFRTAAGHARILDAYCPHLGANLGVGGRVEGETVRCPFHDWRFDGASGQCVEVPYAKKVPPKACVQAWPVLEQNGLVYVYHHVECAQPEWKPDVIPEVGHPDFALFRRREWTIRSHPQEVMENGVDYAHFQTLHQWDASALRWKPDGVRYTLEIDVATESDHQAATASHATTVNSYNSGPGFLFTRVTGAMRGVALNMLTPIDEELLRVQHAYYANKDVPRETVAAFFDAYEADWKLDFPIWDNKLHLARPMLAEGEGDVARFRKWYRQFYTPAQLAEAAEEAEVVAALLH